MTKTIETAEAVLARIEREADEKKVHETRRVERMSVGQVVRQGDIYVHRVSDEHERGAPMKTRQLVRGVTNGSRHVAESPAKAFEGKKTPEWARNAILGPVLVSRKRFQVTHPEHAWLDLPAGVYQVTLQRDARTNQAVRD